MYILRCEGWTLRFGLHDFGFGLQASGKHLPRPDPTEPRAGCVIDTGVLKLTVSASAAELSGTCKACRCGGYFARRVHAGTVNAPCGGGGVRLSQNRELHVSDRPGNIADLAIRQVDLAKSRFGNTAIWQ